MPQLLRACALVFLVCAACDAGSEPRVGSPGLEPPRSTDDGGLGEDSDPGLSAGGAGSGSASAGTTGSSGTPPGAGTSGGAGMAASAGAGGNATGAGGAGGAMTSSDGGVNADAGVVPFSELHQAEIMKDCSESVQCLLQRDEQLEPDPLNACLGDSAALLDENPQLQERFLTIVQRCSAFVVCDYYDCATSAP